MRCQTSSARLQGYELGLRATVLIFVMLLILLAPAALAEEDCSDQPLCVSIIDQDLEILILIRNSSSQDASAEFEWQLDNVQHAEPLPTTYVIKAGESRQLTTLQIIDQFKPSKYAYSFKWVYGAAGAKHDDSAIYRLPYKTGTQQYVSQSCNGRLSHNRGVRRNAIDFDLRKGTAVHAARAGKVIDLHEVSMSGGTSQMHLDDANYVRLQHSDGTVASYVHLRTMGVKVNIGDEIKAGQFIAYSGDTGYASGPHLHFDVLQINSVGDAVTIAVKWQTARGVLSCPRQGLALRAT